MALPPIISCFVKIQNGSTSLVPAYPGCPGKKGCQTGVATAAAIVIVVNCLTMIFKFT